jgi:hypothetical protein
MSKAISEQTLEVAIVADLVKGHYVQRPPSAFDKGLCLDPGPLIDFIQATQPKEWAKFVVDPKGQDWLRPPPGSPIDSVTIFVDLAPDPLSYALRRVIGIRPAAGGPSGGGPGGVAGRVRPGRGRDGADSRPPGRSGAPDRRSEPATSALS